MTSPEIRLQACRDFRRAIVEWASGDGPGSPLLLREAATAFAGYFDVGGNAAAHVACMLIEFGHAELDLELQSRYGPPPTPFDDERDESVAEGDKHLYKPPGASDK